MEKFLALSLPISTRWIFLDCVIRFFHCSSRWELTSSCYTFEDKLARVLHSVMPECEKKTHARRLWRYFDLVYWFNNMLLLPPTHQTTRTLLTSSSPRDFLESLPGNFGWLWLCLFQESLEWGEVKKFFSGLFENNERNHLFLFVRPKSNFEK